MIKLSHISKSFFGNKIVNDLSLEIKESTIFGFLGPNGAGKTTTIKMIVGLSKPDSGKILINKENPRKRKTRENIGFMPENPSFYDQLSAWEFLKFMDDLFPSSCHSEERSDKESRLKPHASPMIGSRSFATAQRGPFGAQDDPIHTLLKQVGLENVGKKRIKEFSKGMKQRLGLAQALVNDPDYIFLDEPLDGLDPIGRLEFKKILLDLKKRGKTIFFNSHILSDVEEICDSIGILNKGKLVYAGNVKNFVGKSTLEKKFVDVIKDNK